MKLCDDPIWLQQQYDQGKSLRDIAKLAGVSKPTIKSRFIQFDIQTRTISEALKIKPSKHVWTSKERQLYSDKMKLIQSKRKEELSISASRNWYENREKIVDGIRKAGHRRRRLIDVELLLKTLNDHTLRETAMVFACSVGLLRRRLRIELGINDLSEYKRLKIDADELLKTYNDLTQVECGKIFGCSATKISNLLLKLNANTSIHFGDKFKLLMSEEIKKRWLNEEYQHKMALARAAQPSISSIQRQLYSILDELCVSYLPEVVIGPYTFDCQIGDLLIECNGDYWHSLDKVVRNDDTKSNYIYQYHQQLKLRVLWEHEFANIDRIKNILRYWLNGTVSINQFKFSDLVIRDITNSDYKAFLGKYHYLPYCSRFFQAVGAYYHDDLIAVVVFAPLVRQNLPYDYKTTVELARLCIHPEYQIKNLGSWLISKAISRLSQHVATIISYCDTTYNHTGVVYRASNFDLDHVVRADYWYTHQSGWVLHKKTVYNRAIKVGLTESDYATQNGLKKICGGEKLCFIYHR